eukprot:2855458-Alexandrium_andersonii.AAC.1
MKLREHDNPLFPLLVLQFRTPMYSTRCVGTVPVSNDGLAAMASNTKRRAEGTFKQTAANREPGVGDKLSPRTLQRTAWPFGGSETAASSSWALAADLVSATSLRSLFQKCVVALSCRSLSCAASTRPQ